MADITKHKWSDEGIVVNRDTNSECLHIFCSHHTSGYAHFNRNDAITIANHFALLPDLKKGCLTLNTGETITVKDDNGLPVALNWREDL